VVIAVFVYNQVFVYKIVYKSVQVFVYNHAAIEPGACCLACARPGTPTHNMAALIVAKARTRQVMAMAFMCGH
jgi:hypothetical protein